MRHQTRDQRRQQRRQQRKHPRHQRWVLNLLASACLCVATPARPAYVEWTGNAPIFVAQWFNGFTNVLETHEFQYLLDWHGYCNAHSGSICERLSFWDSSRNWSSLRAPGPYDDVNIASGNTVLVSYFDSSVQGRLRGFAQAPILNAGDATININFASVLTTGGGGIGRLGLGLGSILVNNGLLFVNDLMVSEGETTGNGRTELRSISAPLFYTLLSGGHTLALTGNYDGQIDLQLSGKSRFVNSGILSASGAVRLKSGQVIDLFYFPNTFSNLGTIDRAITINYLRFDNDGDVNIDSGNFTARGVGTHAGSFVGGAGSQLLFDAVGPAAITHHFLPGSSIKSEGRVVFGKAGHLIEGFYDVADTVIGTTSGDVTFAGPGPLLHKVAVQASSNVHFQTGGTNLRIGELSLNGRIGFAFFTGAASTIPRVTINDGGINTASGLTISDQLTWRSGTLRGPVFTPGHTDLYAGVRTFYDTIVNTGTARWHEGSFGAWGVYDNQVGGSFDIQGDHSLSVTSGRFDNAGTLKKSAGTGRATWSVPVNNSGTVEVLTGTLALRGGGSHRGAFTAAPGALLELAGANTITAAVTTQGRVDVTGGDFTVLAGGSYTNAAGNRMQMAKLDNRLGGLFTNDGLVDNVSASVSNSGSLINRAGASLTARSLVNSGNIDNAALLTVSVGGFRNAGELVNSGAFTVAGPSVNNGTVFNSGSVTIGSDFTNTGDITSSGSVTNGGSFINNGRITNWGSFANSGFLTIGATGRLTGSGTYLQSGGDTVVDGLLEALGGIDIQTGSISGTGTVVGDVVLGIYASLLPGNSPGTLMVNGNLALNGALYSPTPNLAIEIASKSVYDRLLVSGSATFNEALVDLLFVNGAQLHDSDTYTWLSAGSIADTGMRVQVTGLPTGWSSQITNTGSSLRLTVLNEPEATFASQIARSGLVQIAAAEVASNWAGDLTDLEALDNAGTLLNYQGADLWTRSLINQAGATLINRGSLTVACCFGSASNAGLLRNRAGAELVLNSPLDNTGSLINHGTVTLQYGMSNAAGGQVETHGVLNNRGPYFLPIFNRGSFVVGGTLNNSGTIRNEEGGRFTVLPDAQVLGAGSYWQLHGSNNVTRVDGVLAASSLRFQGGRLTGSGSLAGPVTLSQVIVSPGNSPGMLTIDGSLAASGSLFEIELASATQADQLHVTGAASFSYGLVAFYLTDGYRPQIGDHFQWLQADGGVSGLGSMEWRIYTSEIGAQYAVFWQPPQGMQVAFQGGQLNFTAAAVPEPGNWLLMLAGIAGLALLRKAGQA